MSRDDDYNRRFRELIHDEFGIDPDPEPEPFSFDEAMERADGSPDPWDEFVPEDPGPIGRPRNPLVALGVAMLLLAAAWAIVALVVDVPVIISRVVGVLGIAGLAVLIFSVPRHRADPDDEGIRL